MTARRSKRLGDHVEIHVVPPVALSPDLGRLFAVDQVAEYLQTSLKSVRRRINAGELTAIRIGRMVRIPESDLIAYLQRQRSR